jgi:hypothetical protein
MIDEFLVIDVQDFDADDLPPWRNWTLPIAVVRTDFLEID